MFQDNDMGNSPIPFFFGGIFDSIFDIENAFTPSKTHRIRADDSGPYRPCKKQ
jgi:hypothetical protein